MIEDKLTQEQRIRLEAAALLLQHHPTTTVRHIATDAGPIEKYIRGDVSENVERQSPKDRATDSVSSMVKDINKALTEGGYLLNGPEELPHSSKDEDPGDPAVGESPDDTLRRSLASALNFHSRENNSGTPDFILSDFLVKVLIAFEETVRRREAWNLGRLGNV